MFKHVLVPMDGSDHAEKALDVASDVAERYEARVSVVGALDATALTQVPSKAELEAEWLANFQHYVDDELMRVPEARRGEAAAVYGEPAAMIIQYASEHDVDLVVMSTHGIGAKGGYALGSVALKVLQTAPCPVLLRRID